MCGLFGFDGDRPDRGRLALVARLASRRGPHALGVAWGDGEEIRAMRCTAPNGAKLEQMLTACERAPRIIGHYRLSTSGDWRTPANNQPILVGDVAVAHNGNIPDWRERAGGIRLSTGCDSELIAHWIGNPGRGLQLQLNQALRELPFPYAVLALRADELAWRESGLPLFQWWCPEGAYFCSLDPTVGPWLPVQRPG